MKNLTKKRLMSMLLAMIMVFSLLPMGVLAADDSDAQESQETPAVESKGEYTLTVKNSGEATQKVKYEITVNGKSQTVKLATGESYSVGINEKDSYSVKVIGTDSPYYDLNMDKYRASFLCGDVTKNFQDNEWKHVLGEGFPTGEYDYYYYDGNNNEVTNVCKAGDEFYDGDTYRKYNVSSNRVDNTEPVYYTMNVAGHKKGDFWYNKLVGYKYSVKFELCSGGVPIEKTKETGLMDLDRLKVYKSLADECKADVQKSEDLVMPYYENDDREILKLESFYEIANKLTVKSEERKVPCPANNVVIDTVPVVVERTGGVSVDAYNVERLNYLENNLNAKTIASAAVTVAQNSDVILNIVKGNIDTDDVEKIVNNDLLDLLVRLAMLKDMPESTVTLTEIEDLTNPNYDTDWYEGKTYTLNASEINLKLVGAEIPLAIAINYALEGVRIGKYHLTVNVPNGDGWYTDNCPTEFDITISEGKTASGIGEYRKYLKTGLTDLSYQIKTNAVWFNRLANSMTFTKVDMGMNKLEGATFVLLNRDQTLEFTATLLSLGRQAIDSAINDKLGGLTFDEITQFQNEVANGTDNVTADKETVNSLLATYVGIIYSDKTIKDLKAPAILEAKSDANGVVYFADANNVTIPVIVDLLISGKDILQDLGVIPEEIEILGKNISVDELVDMLTAAKGSNAVYYILYRVGIVGDKFPTGTYVMYEKEAPEGYFRNLAMYTVENTWNLENMSYDSYAQLGVIAPIVAGQFYDYAKQLADKCEQFNEVFLQYVAKGDVAKDYISKKIAENPEMEAALVAYLAELIYGVQGDDAMFESPEAVANAIMKALDSDEFSFEKIAAVASDLMSRSRKIVAGNVDKDWYYYNINKNIFKNASSMFDYVMRQMFPDEIVDAVEPKLEEVSAPLVDATDAVIEKISGVINGDNSSENN